jgi:hypothetical protein
MWLLMFDKPYRHDVSIRTITDAKEFVAKWKERVALENKPRQYISAEARLRCGDVHLRYGLEFLENNTETSWFYEETLPISSAERMEVEGSVFEELLQASDICCAASAGYIARNAVQLLEERGSPMIWWF